MLEELIKSNTFLTKTNAKLSTINKTITDKNCNLRREVGSLKKYGGGGGGGRGGGGGDNRGLKNFTNCKRDVYQVPNKFFELE